MHMQMPVATHIIVNRMANMKSNSTSKRSNSIYLLNYENFPINSIIPLLLNCTVLFVTAPGESDIAICSILDPATVAM